MKTKFLWVVLLAGAAFIGQAQGGGHHGGGGRMGGVFPAARSAPARGGAGSSFRSMPMRHFGGSRTIYSGQRFSSVGTRSPSSAAFRRHYINSNRSASIGTRQFTSGNINRSNRLTRFGNNPRGAQGRDGFGRGDGAIEDCGNGARQIRHANNLPANWRNHVVARHPASWHRDWDHGRDHWWRGHRCRFINGSWVIFDLGFYPWWPYGYPSDYYYPYDSYAYPYSYDPGYYDSDAYQGEEYYDQNGYESSVQNADSTVAAAQEQLAREDYYRGEIDGIFGLETRRAIIRYQSDHRLPATGRLNTDTLQALRWPQVASS
jgi:Putative peptidoglycan binding domain